MNATLPPAAVDALNQAAAGIKHEATPPVIEVTSVSKGPGFFSRCVNVILSPFKAILRFTAMSALTAALVITISAVVGLVGYITGSEQQRLAAVVQKDEIISKFAKELPLNVEFKQGAVESYGFIRNWLWRQASDKKFAMSAVISTDRDANTAMKNTAIVQTVGEDQYKLKAGTSDVWQLVPTVTPPPAPKPAATVAASDVK